MKDPKQILQEFWNYGSFKPLQSEIIESILDGNDTFALLPTGGGKSICFQVPAMVKEGICIVISPLVALMRDQVRQLENKGIKALAITSGLKRKELDTQLDNCIYGNYKFLYLSPERLQQELVQNRIKQMNVNLIAVDEAHCISQWGHDFRPSYRNIKLIRDLHPKINIVALTATAKPEVVKDIVSELKLVEANIFRKSFSRPNISYQLINEEDKHYRIEKLLNRTNESSIIYVRNRKYSIDISKFLESKNISSTFYHGGLPLEEKNKNLQLWINNEKQVMVATNAFGMGIDKPDVKTVIHINLPESLESYFQEAGRAGRNGEHATAIILMNKSDEILLKRQFLDGIPSIEFIKNVYKRLCNYFQISYGEGPQMNFDFDFYEFCKTYNFDSRKTYDTLQILERNSIIGLEPQFTNTSLIQFLISGELLLNYLKKNSKISEITRVILRTYGGIFDQGVKINIGLIASKANTSQKNVVATLKYLENDSIIKLKLGKSDINISFIQPREDDKTINRIATNLELINTQKKNQIQAVLNYVENKTVCRSIQLLSYFGEADLKTCGICSICKPGIDSNISLPNLKEIVIKKLKESNMSSRDLGSKTNLKDNEIKRVLIQLLEENKIEITKSNTYKLKK